jgi:hypothetical protein
MEEEPPSLWVALQGCYEQQKAIPLPEANHEWTQIHFQDFKSIEDYNNAIHKFGTPFKGSNVQCRAGGGFKHTAEKCRTPKHLVALYQKSLGKDKKAQGSGSGGLCCSDAVRICEK